MRSIMVVTGTRAEYGLFFWLLRALQDAPDLDLRLLVTGMHLSPEFGMTCRTIEADGFPIAETVEMLLSSDTPVGVSKSIGLGVIGCAEAFDRQKPDLVMVLGDRFEILAASQAAMIAGIPLAHLHGGEVTEGAYDEQIRHALTKMSALHFTSTEVYRNRILQMGENPVNVHCCGALGLEHLLRSDPLPPAEIQTRLGHELSPKSFLVTFHPETLAEGEAHLPFEALLDALDAFPDYQVLFTYPNADNAGRILIRMLTDYVQRNPGRAFAHPSMGSPLYLSVMRNVAVVIGNSSSGIIETPSLGIPTINIGDRQKGRLRSESVIDVPAQRDAMIAAIRTAIDPAFREACRSRENPYQGLGEPPSAYILAVLRQTDFSSLRRKHFFDRPFDGGTPAPTR